MTLKEAIQVARKVLYGETADPMKKTQAYSKLAQLHGVMDELELIMKDNS